MLNSRTLTIDRGRLTFLRDLLQQRAAILFTRTRQATHRRNTRTRFTGTFSLRISHIFRPFEGRVIIVNDNNTTQRRRFNRHSFNHRNRFFQNRTNPRQMRNFRPQRRQLVSRQHPNTDRNLVRIIVHVSRTQRSRVLTNVRGFSAKHKKLLTDNRRFGSRPILRGRTTANVRTVNDRSHGKVFWPNANHERINQLL